MQIKRQKGASKNEEWSSESIILIKNFPEKRRTVGSGDGAEVGDAR